MQIAIIGPGRMGSMFAYHLSRAGHDVTTVARGARLQQLQRDNAIVTVAGERAPVKVSATLDASTPWDLVLVMVLATQVDPLLPTLAGSAAKRIMFMFNTFEPLARLRDAVGPERFAFGFPTIAAGLADGKLKSATIMRVQLTTVTHAETAAVFNAAGIPANTHPDMESFLRAHAASVVPLMAIACAVAKRGAGITWSEAHDYARALSEAFDVVRKLGNSVTPTAIAAMSHVPEPIMAPLLWSFSRTQVARDLAELGPGEAQSLIDAMCAAAPGQTAKLQAIRPS